MLAASVETATQNFLEKGEKIAKESQFLKDELTAAVEDVRKQGILKVHIATVCVVPFLYRVLLKIGRVINKSQAMYISSAPVEDLEIRIWLSLIDFLLLWGFMEPINRDFSF